MNRMCNMREYVRITNKNAGGEYDRTERKMLLFCILYRVEYIRRQNAQK